jgi:hypothetical protein
MPDEDFMQQVVPAAPAGLYLYPPSGHLPMRHCGNLQEPFELLKPDHVLKVR